MPGIQRTGGATLELTITPHVCECKLRPQVFATGRVLERLVVKASGYYEVYIGFYGDQTRWLDFEIVDIRDGQVLWRNGRLLVGSTHGKQG